MAKKMTPMHHQLLVAKQKLFHHFLSGFILVNIHLHQVGRRTASMNR
jgi:hypothetical protein